ncbi:MULTISPECIES: alpha/beta hydrolase [Legionella]|uniref:Alpha/beta fold hydrolase n=1 Tax=Legionella septentrionalis TaxID=2498109 RepID=A0A433JLP0_9GAMM|nr:MULTISPECIES: hypothetical protein [Legionella]MCP0913919.1 hypothetical protein [Legionella sp. 27cVA30]RUQ90416.1 hypothetical protein EKM59_02080 [Legionella septentrionalis]RUR10763.1 hypothetical protein ELY14_04280 [Legionella septentrionalis]RUR16484.1 hypothetical protein ELY10_03045 [Legionella septentrionalis]
MQLSDLLSHPGEHSLFLQGEAGSIETMVTVPEQPHGKFIALLGHPHSLQGGTMNNKVVTTLARTFKDIAIPSIRFNFRGVGESAGTYDGGIGESADMRQIAELALQAMPKAQCIFAGFSFGSYVAYRAAAHFASRVLITVAPPVHHFDYHEFLPPHPWIILQGNDDDVVPASLVLDFCKTISPEPYLLQFEETGHFFHGKLIELKTRLIEALRSEAGIP